MTTSRSPAPTRPTRQRFTPHSTASTSATTSSTRSAPAPDFRATERRTAETVAGAAAERGLSRVVYLGGLTSSDERVSEHLASRTEVSDVLLDSGVPTAVLRAGVIIGSGSASFEMLRYLTERLPLMITPRWVRSRVQPIAILMERCNLDEARAFEVLRRYSQDHNVKLGSVRCGRLGCRR